MFKRVLVALLLFQVTLGGSMRVAFADEPAADSEDAKEKSRAAFRRGVELAKKGDYAHARDAFQEAYRLFQHPSILLNLGIAHSKTAEYAAAEEDLVRFLGDDGGATNEELHNARTILADVRTHLGTLKLRVSPDAARASLD